MKTATLQRRYREYNRKYFGGKLCASVGFDRNNCKKWICWGYALGDIHIAISEELRNLNRTAYRTLLHEMAHVNLERLGRHDKKHHGANFDKEMLRLAKMGAFHDIW